MFVELLPEAIGLMVTPSAIVGTILLLESSRPIPKALAFGAAFGLLYSVLSIVVLGVGEASGDSGTSDATRLAGWAGVVIGSLFVLGGVVVWARHPVQRHGDAPTWMRKLEEATPRTAFLFGLAAASLNPNVLILLSGLSIVVAADVSTAARIAGAAFLVAASLVDFLVPIGVYLGRGEGAAVILGRAKVWMIAHARIITIVLLLGLGLIFVVRGLAKL